MSTRSHDKDVLATVIAEINKRITNKCKYVQYKTKDGEVLLAIILSNESTTKIGELHFVINEFLKCYTNPAKFLVEVVVSEKVRESLSLYFYEYTIRRNSQGHLIFEKRSAL